MPCPHKFQQYLNLADLDFEPQTLVVGTFNPTWPEGNNAEWFYGRSDNNFWEVLPRIYGQPSLRASNPTTWKAFCRENRIGITDLIFSVDDADIANNEHQKYLSNFSDKNLSKKFSQYTFTDIIKILNRYPSVRYVYLTRGDNETFWRRLWNPIKQYCKLNQIRPQTLITPSGYAFYQINRYNRQHPNNPAESTVDFILKRWMEVWHPLNQLL